jgi:hypothetical protein
MTLLAREAGRFAAERRQSESEARQIAVFFLMCGVDLADALAATGADRTRIATRVARLVERERLKGVRRHWSYDLNRHMALKQALDRLVGPALPASGEACLSVAPTGPEAGPRRIGG